MPSAEINGTSIYFEDTGGDKPAVLFSHGFLMDHTMFDPQVDALHDHYRCVRWDERGFGKTRATGPFTYWDSADDAVGLLDHLGIDDAVFVGMSQGGYLSLRAALRYPERVRALVLIDSAADLDDQSKIGDYEAMVHVFTNGTDEQRQGVFQIVSGLLLGDDDLAAHWIPRWAEVDREQLGFAGRTLLDRDDLTDRMGEITCPVLSIHGTDDHSIEISRAYDLAERVADHRGMVEVAGAAHAPNLSHPEHVNPPLRAFLDSL